MPSTSPARTSKPYDMAQRRAEGRAGPATARDGQQHLARARRRRAFGRRQRLAHHHLGHRAPHLLARGAGRHHLAQPQDRGASQSVRISSSLWRYRGSRCPRPELAQRLEQDLDLLRGQHAGRLVHDQQLGVLQQAADDLDPLAFARRQIAHQPVGVERQAVGLRHLADRWARSRIGGGFPCRARRSRPRRAPRTARNAGTPSPRRRRAPRAARPGRKGAPFSVICRLSGLTSP
jgi:hypothetical protein